MGFWGCLTYTSTEIWGYWTPTGILLQAKGCIFVFLPKMREKIWLLTKKGGKDTATLIPLELSTGGWLSPGATSARALQSQVQLLLLGACT